ncbi:TetR/AcrR family transcriptional regulator [Aeromicrobium sp. A1-2]|uniref:TetR/AcrR family transcriptional regulator n=1 Tax=Aeromicrobium sp. A1-2 TaxID=2107713 RepID=UPI000E4FC34A|nr:TetR/AcrR family transcriptional regulator [Aeromicrobium sp. A1-2]AXT83855.1 TetR/AcrR family transcriptional regulator [Aeromicrobium sp. A1-2]
MTKKEQLTEAATDYALERGLIGLSLRPMAAQVGTSDRMLIYHFGSKDELVAAVLDASNARSMAYIRAMPPAGSLRQAILDLWSSYTQDVEVQRCQRMYVEAAALGLLGREPYASLIRASNILWIKTLADYLARSGVPGDRTTRIATLVDATFNGVFLDRPLDGDAESRRIIEDLADALT